MKRGPAKSFRTCWWAAMLDRGKSICSARDIKNQHRSELCRGYWRRWTWVTEIIRFSYPSPVERQTEGFNFSLPGTFLWIRSILWSVASPKNRFFDCPIRKSILRRKRILYQNFWGALGLIRKRLPQNIHCQCFTRFQDVIRSTGLWIISYACYLVKISGIKPWQNESSRSICNRDISRFKFEYKHKGILFIDNLKWDHEKISWQT
jgi:hypothetical protein